MKYLSLAVAALLGLTAATNSTRNIWIDPETRSLRDAEDRHVIFHGVNVVYKVPPYYPEDNTFEPTKSLTGKDMDDLQKWGLNFVRLGVMWESVETAPGVYDQDYLDHIDKVITELGQRGIYTLVDAH
mmetsp:Transcript_28061/g.42423  ORF Transcript_28061/g.42423 Transcript_28061/m.42423 type:complete len:128 (+) Transcript_28061:2-385(+)